jgi:cytidyltransferase-like protein
MDKGRYGVYIGRFQPLHLGHQAVINEILLDGLIPLIVLGSSNEDRNKEKNPLSFKERVELIDLVYPETDIHFISSYDYPNWTDWYNELGYLIIDGTKRHKDELIIYYNEKEADRCSFECNNKTYKNTFYTDIFKDEDFKMKKIKFPSYDDIYINANARDIRANLEDKKHLLDARVYKKLKEWGWK